MGGFETGRGNAKVHLALSGCVKAIVTASGEHFLVVLSFVGDRGIVNTVLDVWRNLAMLESENGKGRMARYLSW